MDPCPSCGRQVASPRKFCRYCGVSLAHGHPCPRCGTRNEAGSNFCKHCGLALGTSTAPDLAGDAREEQAGPPPAAQPPAPELRAAPAPPSLPPTAEAAQAPLARTFACPSCGAECLPGRRFCRRCGNPLPSRAPSEPSVSIPQEGPVAASFRGEERRGSGAAPWAETPASVLPEPQTTGALPTERAPESPAPPETPPTTLVLLARARARAAEILARPSAKTYLVGITVAVVILAGLSYVFWFSPKEHLLREARKGNLVTPVGESAYDLFVEMKKSGLDADDAAEIGAAVLPLLLAHGDAAFQRWHDESDLGGEDWSDVERLYTWAVELDGADRGLQARFQYARGQLAFYRKNYRSADSHYREAARLASGWALPVNGLGRIAVGRRNFSAAEAYYRRAMVLEPRWVYPVLNVAGVYLHERRYGRARHYYRRAVQLDPDNAFAHRQLGLTCERLGRFGLARRAYERALDLVRQGRQGSVDPVDLRRRIARVEARLRMR